MELHWTFLIYCIAIFLPSAFLLRRRRPSTSAGPLPPGPPGWPVFGNMFDLGSMPHRTIANLKKQYGPVVWLKLGSINTMSILNAKSATELFKNHDANFAERTITEVMKAQDFHKAAISLAPYGSYWRLMKRIMTVEMLIHKRIVETEMVRRRSVENMVKWIDEAVEIESKSIDVAYFVFLASFNMLGNLMLSRDLVSPKSDEGSEFFAAMIDMLEWSGHPNIVDLFPSLKKLDPQGLKRRMATGMEKTLTIVGGFVAERLRERELNGVRKKDFLEVLLESGEKGRDEQEKISLHDLNIIIMEVFIAGTETTTGTSEWAMVELLNHPNVMKNVKDELANVVGKGNNFEEKHIDDLPYLQAVVKETLRLHPPIPFLVPRKSTEATTFMGYHIPKNTQLFVNTWAIGRDPDCYEDPLLFKPDRFIGSKVDYRGQSFELLPFGAGRRICAGIPLAHRMLHLVVGSLLHEFDWEVDEIGRKGVMDDRERMGVTVRKLVPLKAIPKRCST